MNNEPKSVSEAEQLLFLLDQMHSEASGVRELAHKKLKNVTKERPGTEPEADRILETWSPLFAQMRSRVLDTISEMRYTHQSLIDAELP